MNQNHPTSKILQTYLVAEGLFSGTLSADYALYMNAFPPQPTKIAALFDTAGTRDGRLMESGETIFHEGVQLRVRGLDNEVVREKIQDVVTNLASLQNEEVEVDTSTYEIKSVSQTSPILPLGMTEDKGRKVDWVCNFLLTITLEEES